MKRHLNTLFVTSQGAYLAKEGQALAVRIEQEVRLRVPLHNLGGIVCFGRVACSPAAMAMCAEAGVAITYLTEHGRFLARVSGFTPGNVLLRRQQYRLSDDASVAANIARSIVAAKVANCRGVLLRAQRDYRDGTRQQEITAAADRLALMLDDLQRSPDLNRVRGLEGESAKTYFAVFDHLIVGQKDKFMFQGRSKRPPLDNVNAVLSFLYAMLAHDMRAACEAAGLDAAVGFLHRDRPGRPGLALDLMEEFRPFLADRLALSVINRRQVQADGFTKEESRGVRMNDATRKTLIAAYQKRKLEEIMHPYLGEKTTIGILLHLQARLLARHVRGDLDAYPAFLWK